MWNGASIDTQAGGFLSRFKRLTIGSREVHLFLTVKVFSFSFLRFPLRECVRECLSPNTDVTRNVYSVLTFERVPSEKEQENTHKYKKILKEKESKCIRRGSQKTGVFLKCGIANWVMKYNNVTKQKAYITVNKMRERKSSKSIVFVRTTDTH